MAVDRWFIGGGAEHTPESARRLVYASTSGAEGVGGVDDLKVSPLAVPGAGVRVLVGSALIRSRYVGGETQTYMGTVYQQETAAIAATGSGSGRSDLIVMSIEDPFAAGSPFSPPAPGDIATAPYVFIRVISGVPSGATRVQDVPGRANDTSVALARVDIPASTGTITAGMIIDLRKVALPKSKEHIAFIPGPNANNNLTSGSYVAWPPSTTGVVDIPEWATHAYIDAEVVGYRIVTGPVAGYLRAQIIADSTEVSTAGIYYNEQMPDGWSRFTTPVGGRVAIPANMRGKSGTIRTQGKKDGGAGAIQAAWGTLVQWRITFAEEV